MIHNKITIHDEFTVIENSIEYWVSYYKYQNGVIDEFWYKDKIKHRENGAAETVSNVKYYWLNGVCYPDIKNDDEWLIKQIIE